MQRRITFAPGEYYHVYNRGVEKRNIFLIDSDRVRFQRMLYLTNGTKPVVYKLIQGRTLDSIDRGEQILSIGAYCLMSNHFHLLVRENDEGGVSQFLRKLTTGYSMYFNKVNDRVGPLFQSRFKAEHVDRDEYLKYLYTYIHLNPVKLIDAEWKEHGISDPAAAKAFLEKYRWSSYPDYLGHTREESAILDTAAFPEYFTEPGDFEAEINEWLAFKQENEDAWGNPPPESQKEGFAIDGPGIETDGAFDGEFKEILRP